MDLSTLDETKPVGSDNRADGDDRIRETRDAVKTSFAVEHQLAGSHAFVNGNDATRPGSGNSGRVWFNTEREWVEYHDGSEWKQLHGTGSYTAIQNSVALTTVTTTVLTTATIYTRANSKLVYFCFMEGGSTASGQTFTMSSSVDGVANGNFPAAGVYASAGGTNIAFSYPAFATVSSAGSHTVSVLGGYAFGTAPTVNVKLVVLVI